MRKNSSLAVQSMMGAVGTMAELMIHVVWEITALGLCNGLCNWLCVQQLRKMVDGNEGSYVKAMKEAMQRQCESNEKHR